MTKLMFWGIFLTAIITSHHLAAQIPVRTLLDNMHNAIASVKKVSFEMYSKERFGGKYIEKDMLFKIHETPKKVYMKDLKDGIELLYVNGWNDNEVYINPNGFPWTNVSFAITNSRVRDESHHLVTSAGFGFTSKLLKRTEEEVKKRGEAPEKYFSIQGETDFDGRKCYKLYMEYKDFKYQSYTVTKDEDLHALCERLCVPEFAVKEYNKIGFGKVKAGKVLQIPSAYAQKVVFFIDKQTFLPVVQMLYDDKGLYEKYEYRKLQVNPSFPAEEWTTKCTSYGF